MKSASLSNNKLLKVQYSITSLAINREIKRNEGYKLQNYVPTELNKDVTYLYRYMR